jgi:hypothetical protein
MGKVQRPSLNGSRDVMGYTSRNRGRSSLNYYEEMVRSLSERIERGVNPGVSMTRTNTNIMDSINGKIEILFNGKQKILHISKLEELEVELS